MHLEDCLLIPLEVIIIKNYDDEIELYYELKGTPEVSIESYYRRIQAFLKFIQSQNKNVETINKTDIPQYILYGRKDGGNVL